MNRKSRKLFATKNIENLQGRPVDQTVHWLTDLSNPVVNINCVGTVMCIPKKTAPR